MFFTQPWFVQPVQPIELFFFRRVFNSLLNRHADDPPEEKEPLKSQDDEQEVPLVEFQRAMVRLFRVIKDDSGFDAAKYDVNNNGKVGWYEFCALWKERNISVRLTLAERVFLTLEDGSRSIAGKCWAGLVVIAIIVSTGSFIFSTLPDLQDVCPSVDDSNFDESCKPKPVAIFATINLVCAVFFTVEYGIRLCLSPFMRTELVDKEKALLLEWMVTEEIITMPTRRRRILAWATHWSNVIDLAAILPWYLSELSKFAGDDESVVLQIIRLTRVVRVFRLGRRLEAVVIIMRSVKRSLRALWVLLLNLFLGMIIFGALMYFAEQGTWDPDTRAYLRWEDSTTRSKSPFESIPACFWWAIVTATTVGYGDDHTPTSVAGKCVAAISMVWSLCVLALPIGVIGGNFALVWDDYDYEKRKEASIKASELTMLKKSMAWGDPLHNSRRLILELWHDPGELEMYVYQSEFLGEVDCLLELDPNTPVKARSLRLPLKANFEKARRNVRGMLTFEYSWEPDTTPSPDVLLQGKLEVVVVKAEDIIAIDWTGPRSSDPYCMITAHPRSPDKSGKTVSATARTPTQRETTFPRWDHRTSFDVCWSRATLEQGLFADMMGSYSSVSKAPTGKSFIAGPAGSDSEEVVSESEMQVCSGGTQDLCDTNQNPKLTILRKAIPELQDDIRNLKCVVPQLHAEIADVRRDMQLILAAVRGLQSQPHAEVTDVGAASVDPGGSRESNDKQIHRSSSGVSATVPLTASSIPSTANQSIDSTNLVS